MHPTSLPSEFGIGDLGPEAFHFADFLSETGQSLWQILPLGPTGYGNSPYQSFSAFGGNPLLISPEKLEEDGLLKKEDLQNLPTFPNERVDYEMVLRSKTSLLQTAFSNLKDRKTSISKSDYEKFAYGNAPWLEDFALYMAIKEQHELRPWTQWEPEIARRDKETIEVQRSKLKDKIEFQKFIQFLFFEQWFALKKYCNDKGIKIIGDIPIYVAHDSADVWARSEYFKLDPNGNPTVVAGVPPDHFSAKGQRWGNPIYAWDLMAKTGYKWWIDRFRMVLSQVDIARIDHFRGFEAYWEIPFGGDWWDATKGRWTKGPGSAVFRALEKELGELPVIAEDLGVITPEVDALRNEFDFPGMKILQFAFGNEPRAPEYRPHSHTVNSIVYTGTHDNNTTVGWFTSDGVGTTSTREQVEKERKYTVEYLGTDGSEINWDLIRLAMESVAHTCIIPLQDVLGLGAQARLNRPGTLQSNWEWRFTTEMLTPGIRERLRRISIINERTTLNLPFIMIRRRAE